MKTVNTLIKEVFSSIPDLEVEFDQWIHSQFKPSLSLGMELDDVIRINESEILRWLACKISK